MATIVEGTASWPRRTLALLIDWIACYLVSILILGANEIGKQSISGLTLGIFLAESAFGIALAGASFGQLATRMRVLKLDHSPVPFIPAVVRQLLVCLIIPPLVFRPDGRGLHDMAVDSATYDLSALQRR